MERNNTEHSKILLKVVNDIADFIAPTFGPKGKNILTKTEQGTLAADDGYRIGIDFTSDDPLENAVLDVIKKNLRRFNALYGEGTTGFLLILQALTKELSKLNKPTDELGKAVEEAIKAVRALSKKIIKRDDLRKIALTSYKHKKISEMIADFAFERGENAHLGIEYSPTQETYIEKVDEYEINSGFLDKSMPHVLDEPYVLITDQVISDGQQLVDLMDKIIKEGSKNLLIIAKKVEGTALATALQNHAKKVFHTLVIEETNPNTLEDLQLITGGELFMQAIGLNLGEINISQLGRAKKIMSADNISLLLGNERSTKLKKFCAKLKDNPKRLAKLSGVAGVIKIGSPSPEETTAIQYKVEDVIHAVRLAQKGGMVKGAGETQSKIKTSSYILNKALKAPLEKLKENSMSDDIDSTGVYDPTEVVIGQIEMAVSTALLLTSLGGIQAEKDDNKAN